MSIARAAVTVVNAMATWKGAALGIDLPVKVNVDIIDEGIYSDIIVRGKKCRCRELVDSVVAVLRERTGVNFGIHAHIYSQIPVARGLKSSSAVANALVEEIANKMDLNITTEEVVKLGVESARRAGVTLTGAYDDACASRYGGLVFTDNKSMSILKRTSVEPQPVVLLVPSQRVPTSSLQDRDFSSLREPVERIFHMALRGGWKEAAFLNSLLYTSFFGYNPQLLLEARSMGAVVGLSGKGPAIFAITDEVEGIMDIWKGNGEIIETEVYSYEFY